MGGTGMVGMLRRALGVGPSMSAKTSRTYTVDKTDQEWRRELTPEQYRVLRGAGTERAGTGEYENTDSPGVYRCVACRAELFTAKEKFHSGCGWPAFYAPSVGDNVELITDSSFGMKRTEVRCASCGSHLGHVFEGEGFDTPTDQRYCINSVCLDLEPTG